MVHHKARKLIKELRNEFEKETGKSYKDTYSFMQWLEQNEHVEAQPKDPNARTIYVEEKIIEPKVQTIHVEEKIIEPSPTIMSPPKFPPDTEITKKGLKLKVIESGGQTVPIRVKVHQG